MDRCFWSKSTQRAIDVTGCRALWSCWPYSQLSMFSLKDEVFLTSSCVYFSFFLQIYQPYKCYLHTHSHTGSQGHLSGGCFLGVSTSASWTGNLPVTLISPCHWQITSCLCHSDIFLLLPLVAAFTVTNTLTRTRSWNVCVVSIACLWGLRVSGQRVSSLHGIFTRSQV